MADFVFTTDDTVEVGKRGRKAIEIDPSIRAAFDYAIKQAAWDTYYSVNVHTESDGMQREAKVIAACVKRDLSKMRKEYADSGTIYRLSVVDKVTAVDKNKKPLTVKVSFRVYPASND